jgi:hypothetical protein
MPQLGVTIAVLSLITPRPLDPGTMLAQAPLWPAGYELFTRARLCDAPSPLPTRLVGLCFFRSSPSAERPPRRPQATASHGPSAAARKEMTDALADDTSPELRRSE